MCQSGARVVQEQVLTELSTDDLRTFVVWLPRYPGDERATALASAGLVTDARTRQFWDDEAALGEQFGRVLPLPDRQQFAWDVYMVFDRRTQWDQTPPEPADWMHQLGPDTSEARRLDGDVLRGIVESLVRDL